MEWLDPSESRIGLGCMRLSTDAHRDEVLGLRTIEAALDAGITVFDTAHAYGLDDADRGHNERLLARALLSSEAVTRARVVTKGGMTRPDGRWVPDGRAVAIRRDCEASLAALEGLPIDLYLLHAPDPRVPWPTSVRALGRLVDERLVQRIGVCNVNRRQLDEALDLAPVSAVQVSLSPYDDTAIRGGVVARCEELGMTVMAHSPLGGVRRAQGLARNATVAAIAVAHDATPAEVTLAWLLTLSPRIVAIPGARRPEAARSAARAASLALDDDERARVAFACGAGEHPATQPRSWSTTSRPEVVVVMGIPGAGKSRLAADYAGRGFLRLNRDERGGSLKTLAAELDAQLADGAARVVLDNTYLTRASRTHVVEAAARHRAHISCLWLDIPLEQAQVNMVDRLLERFDGLPGPDELRAAARKEPWLLSPTAQMRTLRELEPPTADEGWDVLSRVPFVRDRTGHAGKHAVLVAAAAVGRPGWRGAAAGADPTAPHLVFDWRPGADAGALTAVVDDMRPVVDGSIDAAVCPHPAGPPICWCRPPLPGLLLAFARAQRLDVSGSTLIGCTSAHRRLAAALDLRFVSVE